MDVRHRQLLGRIWREWVRSLLVVIAVVGCFRSAVADWNDVPTGSMKPTILEGDRIVVNKLAYDLRVPFTTVRVARWAGPDRGDIVILLSPTDRKRLVKRVVGLPGDTIAMLHGRLIMNGAPLEYGPPQLRSAEEESGGERPLWVLDETLGDLVHLVQLTPGASVSRSFAQIRIPEAKYFVMGDNRDESADSRVFGLVDRDEVLGQAVGVALSIDRANHLSPRWQRFGRALR